MNKIFKVIWNRNTQSLVVTSELSKANVKSSSDASVTESKTVKKLFNVAVLLLGLLQVGGNAYAVTATPGGASSVPMAINGGELAISKGAQATGTSALAIGDGTIADGNGAIMIGSKVGSGRAIAKGNNSISIGTNANADGQKIVAIGSDTNVSAEFGTALGAHTKAGNSGTAIGVRAEATNQHDVAIGSNSVTGTAHALTALKIGQTEVGTSGVQQNNKGVVSFGGGTVGAIRQIQNVGAGKISADSTDAINGSQLYHIATATNEIANTEYKFTVGNTTVKTMRNNDNARTNNSNNALDFKAVNGLEVSGTAAGITYGLDQTTRNNISTALTTATEAKSLAETANTTATQAQSTANTAKSTADQARTVANNASTVANQAKDTANAANAAATQAKNTANAANAAATQAKDTANAANAVATQALLQIKPEHLQMMPLQSRLKQKIPQLRQKQMPAMRLLQQIRPMQMQRQH